MLASLFTKPNELWFERRDAEKETQVIFWVLSDLLPNRCRTNFSKFGKFSSSSQVGLSVNCFSRCISVSPPAAAAAAAAACWSDQPAELRIGLFVQVWEVFKQHRLLSAVHSLNLPVDPSWKPIGEYQSKVCQKEASFQHLWNLSPSCRKYQPSPACQWHWTLNSDTRDWHQGEHNTCRSAPASFGSSNVILIHLLGEEVDPANPSRNPIIVIEYHSNCFTTQLSTIKPLVRFQHC